MATNRHPAQPPGTRREMVGRERERLYLQEMLTGTLAGRGSLVLISGEAGIGNTTLVDNWSNAPLTGACRILSGGCYDLTTPPPYGPWIEVHQGSPIDDEAPLIRK